MNHGSRRGCRVLRAADVVAMIGAGVLVCTACRDTREPRGSVSQTAPRPEASLAPAEPEWKSHDIQGVKFSAPKDARVTTGTPLESTVIEIESASLSLRVYSGPSCVSTDRPSMGARQEEVALSAARGELWTWRGENPDFAIEAEARVRSSRDECVSARGRARNEQAYAEMKRILESVVVGHPSQ
jgi:hypothetical protein